MTSEASNLSLAERAKRYSKQKSLGQNFLVDEYIHDSIIKVSDLSKDDIVLEIGAGIGFLTERLIPEVKHLYAIELDSNACTHLEILSKLNSNFSYKNADVLQTNLKDLIPEEHLQPGKIKVVANIPYQITTKILIHLLGEIGFPSENKEYISDIYILVQKEYAERLSAEPGVKDYSAVTLFANYYTVPEYLFTVEAECFQPAPKVTSAFIKLALRDKPRVEAPNPKQLRRFIKAIFANRRKVLSNSLKAAGYSKEEIDFLDLDPKLRGETLTLEQINELVIKLDNKDA